MIARRWHGIVPAALAEDYIQRTREVGLGGYRAIPGNRGAWCFSRREGEIVHIEALSFWDDLESIKRFAGEDYEVAKYYDFDDDYLLGKEPHVLHFEVYEETP